MENSIYEYTEYKRFLLDRIAQAPSAGRGMRRKMADAMKCQVAYVSHILAGDRHLSPEQAEALTRFLGLRNDEAEYFMLLVEQNRAGTRELRAFLDRQLTRRREDHGHLRNRVAIRGKISPENQAVYYSSWHYQAVRMLITIPEFRRPDAIAERLGLKLERVNEILGFFIDNGLARHGPRGQYETVEAEIHLGNDSPLISRLHSNWRIHVLQTLDRKQADDLHYSGAVTLSSSDLPRVREIWMKAVLESHKVIRASSKEERLCVLAADFYEL